MWMVWGGAEFGSSVQWGRSSCLFIQSCSFLGTPMGNVLFLCHSWICSRGSKSTELCRALECALDTAANHGITLWNSALEEWGFFY